MLATARNCDFICLQMRNHLPQMEPSIKKETTKFLNEVKEVVTLKGISIKEGLDKLLPRIFNFRLRSLEWLNGQADFSFLDAINEVSPQIDELRNNKSLRPLVDNLLFALRCNARVVKSIMLSSSSKSKSFPSEIPQFPRVTYEQFLASIALGIPNDAEAQNIVDWVNASLYIEFIVVAAYIINEDGIKIQEKVVNEMAFIIADAAQEYIALAVELGIISTGNKGSSLGKVADKKTLREQKDLADLGLLDFVSNF